MAWVKIYKIEPYRIVENKRLSIINVNELLYKR